MRSGIGLIRQQRLFSTTELHPCSMPRTAATGPMPTLLSNLLNTVSHESVLAGHGAALAVKKHALRRAFP
jgi:hypothetical protein